MGTSGRPELGKQNQDLQQVFVQCCQFMPKENSCLQRTNSGAWMAADRQDHLVSKN